MKLYMYIRLSQADKDLKFKTESESIANQRELLHQFVKSRPEFGLYEIVEFVDDGYSGTNDARPSFERMIDSLKNGDAHLVICKDFSRFFRDYVEIGDYLERIFPFLGVRFISVNDGYDSDEYKGTTGGMDVVMKYIVYSFYSRDLSQKIKTVYNSRVRHGQYLGSYPPYGYIKDPKDKHHLIPDPDTAPVVKEIFSMAVSGKSSGEIMRKLNDQEIPTPSAHFAKLYPNSGRFRNKSNESCWTYSNVIQILKRREYTGALISQKKNWKGIDNPHTTQKAESEWIVVPGCHSPIVSEEDFEKAQHIFKVTREYTRAPLDYPLRSLIRCGVCGRAMSRNNRVKNGYYQCDKSAGKADTKCPVGERFYEKELERIVISDLRSKLQIYVDSNRLLKEAAGKVSGSQEHIAFSIEKAVRSLKQNSLAKLSAYESYSDGKTTREEFLVIRDRLAEEAAALTAEKDRLEADLEAIRMTTNNETTPYLETAEQCLGAESFDNRMLLFFIDRVDVYSGMRVEIKYRFNDN